MATPKPKAKAKAPTAAAHRRAIRAAINAAVDAANPAEMQALLHELVNATSALGSVVSPKRRGRGQLVVMWAHPATLNLMQAVADYAEHVQRPVEEVAYETIMRIGPHVNAPYRWN